MEIETKCVNCGCSTPVDAPQTATVSDEAVQAPHTPIELTYTNYRGETSQRRITPRSVYFGSTEWHPEPQWLLTAYDHDKQEYRAFALNDFGNTVDVAAVRRQAFEEVAAIVDRYPLLSQVSAHIRALSPAEPIDQTDLSWLNTKTNFEISHDWPEGGDESDEGVWKVHSVNGGRSDREWTLIAEDSDLSTAIAKARKVRSAPTSKGGA